MDWGWSAAAEETVGAGVVKSGEEADCVPGTG